MSDDLIYRNRYRFFSVAAIGTFMGTLSGSILIVALPTIASDLQCGIQGAAWIMLSFTLTLVSLLLIFGAWTDKRGYYFAYKFGYVVFTLGTLLCSVSWSLYPLIAGRVIQAIGSSMFQAVGIGMVTDVFPARERGKAIGLIVMTVSAGLMTGPPLGGVLLHVFPWHSVFIISLPVGLVGLWMTLRYLKVLQPQKKQGKVRLAGGVAASVSLCAATLALSLLSRFHVTDFRLTLLALLSIVSLLAFIKIESKSERALIGLDVFRNKQFTMALAAAVLMFTSQAGILIILPFYLQDVRHFEPGTIGLYMIILPLLMFILAPLAGRLSDRIGSRLLTSLGMGTLAVGMYLLSRLGTDTANTYIVLSLVVIGGGSAIFNTPNASALMGWVNEEQRAITSGVISASRNIGMSTGIAVGTAAFAYFQARYANLGSTGLTFVASFHQVALIEMACAIVGLPFCFGRKR
ncbi:MAG TPA: MFS transporter [Candidatus Deferrimicrobium sp.]|nr:MFS transporter [Candidatus Deferrimicrobium sp.]